MSVRISDAIARSRSSHLVAHDAHVGRFDRSAVDLGDAGAVGCGPGRVGEGGVSGDIGRSFALLGFEKGFLVGCSLVGWWSKGGGWSEEADTARDEGFQTASEDDCSDEEDSDDHSKNNAGDGAGGQGGGFLSERRGRRRHGDRRSR